MQKISNIFVIIAMALCSIAMIACAAKPLPERISIKAAFNQTELYLQDSVMSLEAIIYPAEAEHNTEVTWSSSNTNVVQVNDLGYCKAISCGTAVITAKTSNNKKATYTITVSNKPVNSVSVSAEYTLVTVGSQQNLSAVVKPNDAADKNVVWTSSNPAVIEVTETGVATAKSLGTATITATAASGVSDSITITVASEVPVESLSLNKTGHDLRLYSSYTLSYTAYPTNATNTEVTWHSSDPTTVEVDQNGKITALKPGSATITITSSNGKTKSCHVSVYEVHASRVDINLGGGVNQELNNLKVGDTYKLTYKAIAENWPTGDSVVTDIGVWSSSNHEVATIEQDGTITIHGTGMTIIKVQVGSKESSIPLTIYS